MAHPARGVRHAFQSEVGRAGQYSGQDCGAVGMYPSGTQVGERVEKAGTGVHVPQKVGDPEARHERIDRAVEAFARGRRHGVVRRDAQPNVLEAQAFEPTARQLRPHFAQAFVQPFASMGEPDRGVGLEPAFGEHLPGFVHRRQTGVEAAIVPAAFDPYVAGAKPVAQRRDHGGLAGAPGALPLARDHRSPLPVRERHRYDVRQGTGHSALQIAEPDRRWRE